MHWVRYQKTREAGLFTLLGCFLFTGYFWSPCISGKTSTNGTKGSSLTTNSGLYLKLPGVAHTSPTSAPGKADQVFSLQPHIEPSLTRHQLYSWDDRRHPFPLKGTVERSDSGWIWKLRIDGAIIRIFPMPWQLSVVPLANSILCSQAAGILGNMLSF